MNRNFPKKGLYRKAKFMYISENALSPFGCLLTLVQRIGLMNSSEQKSLLCWKPCIISVMVSLYVLDMNIFPLLFERTRL